MGSQRAGQDLARTIPAQGKGVIDALADEKRRRAEFEAWAIPTIEPSARIELATVFPEDPLTSVEVPGQDEIVILRIHGSHVSRIVETQEIESGSIDRGGGGDVMNGEISLAIGPLRQPAGAGGDHCLTHSLLADPAIMISRNREDLAGLVLKRLEEIAQLGQGRLAINQVAAEQHEIRPLFPGHRENLVRDAFRPFSCQMQVGDKEQANAEARIEILSPNGERTSSRPFEWRRGRFNIWLAGHSQGFIMQNVRIEVELPPVSLPLLRTDL